MQLCPAVITRDAHKLAAASKAVGLLSVHTSDPPLQCVAHLFNNPVLAHNRLCISGRTTALSYPTMLFMLGTGRRPRLGYQEV